MPPISRAQADLMLLVAAMVWGSAFYFQKQAMLHIGPMLFVGLRGVISSIALLPLALREQKRTKGIDKALVRLSIWGGLTFLAGGALQQIGLVSATVINGSLLTALYVVIVPLLAWLLFRTPPRRATWLYVAVAFAGSWLLGGGTITGFSAGDWVIALSTIAWAAHILITQAAGRQARPMTYTCIQFAIVGVIGLAIAAMAEPISFSAIAMTWHNIAFVALVSGAMGFALMAVALQHTPAADATIIMSTETLFAVLVGYTFLHERLSPAGWLGGALILAAVILMQLEQYLGRRRLPSPITLR